MVITSKDNKKIKELKKLLEKKYRDKTKTYLIEGIHLVREAKKSGNLLEVILVNDYEIDAKKTFVTDEVISQLSTLKTSYDIIGVCKYSEEKKVGDKILILDNIQDPGNLGTIIRSSVAFNIDTIILSENSVDLYNSKVLRGCQGMNFYINILRKNIKEEIINLKNNNYRIYGTNVKEGKDVRTIDKINKYAIIMGNEGNGIEKEIYELVDENIFIKMNKNCESLNVGIATSIILYELNR